MPCARTPSGSWGGAGLTWPLALSVNPPAGAFALGTLRSDDNEEDGDNDDERIADNDVALGNGGDSDSAEGNGGTDRRLGGDDDCDGDDVAFVAFEKVVVVFLATASTAPITASGGIEEEVCCNAEEAEGDDDKLSLSKCRGRTGDRGTARPRPPPPDLRCFSRLPARRRPSRSRLLVRREEEEERGDTLGEREALAFVGCM